MNVNGDLELEKCPKKTKLKNVFMPKRTGNSGGDKSLLTRGVNPWNAYLIGEETAEYSCLPGKLAAALWRSYVPQS